MKLFPSGQVNFCRVCESLSADELAQLKNNPLLAQQWAESQAEKLGLKRIVFPHQTHSVAGWTIFPDDNFPSPWVREGDFLVTNEPRVGIGVLTADCLPLVIYDRVHNALAVVHAGWQGSINGIALEALKRMHTEYGTDSTDVTIVFGPCARGCCYEVSLQFRDDVIKMHAWAGAVFNKRHGHIFFDLIEFNKELFRSASVTHEQFYPHDSACTMEDTSFYSYRRQKEAAGRNITLAWLE